MKVIDFHSHILPGIDDGSRNVETSLEILRRCKEHGVDTMVATPHFYADLDRVDDFLSKRENAYEVLMAQKEERMPEIFVGAEVAFFSGMSRAQRIQDLTIQGTNLILVEMPFVTWNQSVIDEIKALIYEKNLQVILAHIERFIGIKGNKEWVKKVLELPVLVQVNAEALLEWKGRGTILKLFRRGQAHLLGSDTHGLHRRPPNLWEGRDVLEQKLGKDCMEAVDHKGNEILFHKG